MRFGQVQTPEAIEASKRIEDIISSWEQQKRSSPGFTGEESLGQSRQAIKEALTNIFRAPIYLSNIKSSGGNPLQNLDQFKSSIPDGIDRLREAGIDIGSIPELTKSLGELQQYGLKINIPATTGLGGGRTTVELPPPTVTPPAGVSPYIPGTNTDTGVPGAGPSTPGTTELPGLKPDYGFDELAAYEQAQREEQGKAFSQKLNELRGGVESQYGTALQDFQTTGARRRAELARSLSDTAQKNFQLQNPYILEDLNARGVFTSPTAVNQAQAQALKQLEIGNQGQLLGYDEQQRQLEDVFKNQRLNTLTGFDTAATSQRLQSSQDALDAALDLRRGKLQNTLEAKSAYEQAQVARDLASRKSRNDLLGSVIQLGGTIGGALLCFDGETPINMQDGTERKIKNLILGDKTKGGIVQSIRISITADGTLRDYKGIVVTKSHAVKEDGKWMRIGDSTYAKPLADSGIVYSIITDKHLIYSGDIELADEFERDNPYGFTLEESIKELNKKELVEVA